MAEKILNTRIALKYDTLANWLSSSLVLKAGEFAVAEIPSAAADSGLTPPAIGIKVGDGIHTFSQLGWIQAIAGDVQAWAKAATKPSYNSTEISAEVTTGDGKTVETRIAALEDAQAADLVYRILKDTNSEKWYLQSKAANAQDSAYATVSTIDLVDILAAKQDNLAFDGTYNESTNKVALESTVSDAIAALDGSVTGSAGAGKTLVAFSETDGVVSAEFDDIEITLSQVSDAGTAAAADLLVGNISDDITSTAIPNVAQVADYVDEATAGLSGAMHFKGEVSSIPPATGTYESGDVVVLASTHKEYVYDGSDWIEFGDEGSYALKTITVTGSNGLTGGGTLESDRVISHADRPAATSTADATLGGTANKHVSAVKVDAYGHAFAVEEADDVTYSFAEGSTAGAIQVTPVTGGTAGTPQSVPVHGLGEAAFVDMADAIADGDTGAATGDQVYDYVAGVVANLDGSAIATAADGNAYSVLTGVTEVDGVISKASEVTLAAVAKTGNVNDLIQTSGDVLVLNCGSASTVI